MLYLFFDYFFGWSKSIYKWVVGFIIDYATSLLPSSSSIDGSLPDSAFDFSSLLSGSGLSYLDLFFPVDYAISCFIAYVVIAVTVFTVNWILGLVPTVS